MSFLTEIISKGWMYLSLGLGLLAAFFAATAYRAEAKANKIHAEQEAEARRQIERGQAAMLEGLTREQKVQSSEIDRSRDYFSR